MAADYDWLRLYNDILESPKLLMLSPPDRWYYVGLLVLKNQGVLDEYTGEKLSRVIATKLRLTFSEWDETSRRLQEERLIDGKFQPVGWDDYQYQNKTKRGEAAEMYFYIVGDKAPGANTPVRMGFSKNPWARAKEFRKLVDHPVAVVTTMRTTNGNDQQLLSLFDASSTGDGWFKRDGEILLVINELKRKSLSSFDAVANYVAELRSSDVATTTEYRDRVQRTDIPTAAPCGAGATAPQPQQSGPPDLKLLFDAFNGEDPETELFSRGCSLLVGTGMDYQEARHLIRKWIDDHGQGAALNGLMNTLIAQPQDPREFWAKCLANQGKTIQKDWRPSEPCLSHLESVGVPDNIIRQARDLFVTWYWHTEVPSKDFDGQFVNWCIQDWERAEARQGAYLQRLREQSGFADTVEYWAQ